MINKLFLDKKYIKFVMLIFSFFPLIPNNIKGLPVILFFVVVVFSNVNKKTNWKSLLTNSSLFLLYIFSLIYTEDFKIAARKLETGLSILIIPMIFYGFLASYKFSIEIKMKFFKFFIVSTFCFSILSLIFIVTDNNTIYYSDWYTDKFRSLINHVPLIGQHPIYASIFLSLSIIFFLELIKHRVLKQNQPIFYTCFILFNTFFLFMLVSKGVILALLIVILVNSLKQKKEIKVVFIVFTIIISFLVFNRRAKEMFNITSYKQVNENHSTSIRVGIYKCAFKLVKDKFFLGYGVGDSQEALNICYATTSNVLLKNRYNSHNQFLDVFLKTGFFGFVIFLYFLLRSYREALLKNNTLLIKLITFYCLIFLVENVLVKQSGVIYFFFLVCFLNHSHSINEIKVNENTRFKSI